MPRPVVLDLFNTLLHGADDERDRVVGEMAVMLGVPPAALVAAYNDTWRDRLVRWSVEETVRILAGRILARSSGADPDERADPSEQQVARAAEHRRALAHRVLGAVPATTLDVLDLLRAGGHRLALISNATADTAEAWPHNPLAQRFDVAVFSCEIGLAKPDPGIYRAAAKRLGADPAECIFVGDGADRELHGAAAAGMTAYRTIEFHDSDPSWSGPTLASIGELPALLRQASVGH
ncbi:MAG: HAD family hydrolase [Micromonosporaceae bacterium]|nr:HAD family hydrolase [Micromonosporaceae bacterium]